MKEAYLPSRCIAMGIHVTILTPHLDVGVSADVSDVYAASNFKVEFYADNEASMYLRNVATPSTPTRCNRPRTTYGELTDHQNAMPGAVVFSYNNCSK
jgi:hypothetical protein